MVVAPHGMQYENREPVIERYKNTLSDCQQVPLGVSILCYNCGLVHNVPAHVNNRTGLTKAGSIAMQLTSWIARLDFILVLTIMLDLQQCQLPANTMITSSTQVQVKTHIQN